MSISDRPPLSTEYANRIYDILVERAGARPDDSHRAEFVHTFTSERPTSEYRLNSRLGSGGKFRYPRMSVDCYPEDETAKVTAMMAATNEALTAFKQSMAPSGFFVDWDGNTRRTEAPGDSMTCTVMERQLNGQPYLGVDVLDYNGFVIHEATFFPTREAIEAAGVTVNLVE